MTPDQETLLKRYAQAVVASPLHLTSDRDLRQFWDRHVMDAASLLAHVSPSLRKPGTRVLDVGSGNGIPGIPLAILEPQWVVELLDSDTKKCGFLDMFCKMNAIRNARVFVGRAEALAQGALREQYDLVFARALSKLSVAIELTGAFVAVGGHLIVPHGTSWRAELQASANALDSMGLGLANAAPYSSDTIGFQALTFKKLRLTPREFPRGIGVPEKHPL